MGLLTEDPVPAGFTGTRLGVCNLCEAICGLEITLDGGRVTGVRGNPADPLSRGHICPKGVAIGDIHADPDRLRRPVAVATATTLDRDRLGRGLRPGRRRPGHRVRRARRATRSGSTSATPTCTASAR